MFNCTDQTFSNIKLLSSVLKYMYIAQDCVHDVGVVTSGVGVVGAKHSTTGGQGALTHWTWFN